MKIKLLILITLLLSPILSKELKIFTTLYPLYDFAKTIGGDLNSVSMIIPPGVEPHSFEPSPKDVVKIIKSDLLIYTGPEMEPWVARLLHKVKGDHIVDVSKGIIKRNNDHSGHGHSHAHGEHCDHTGSFEDPHIWLDPIHCLTIVDHITNAFIRIDPKNKSIYLQNSTSLKKQLENLHQQIEKILSNCHHKRIIFAGHFAFGRFAKRYGLSFVSTYHGFSPDAEPSPRKMGEIIKKVRKLKGTAIFHEALITPRLAKTLAHETGLPLLLLHQISNVSRHEMKQNLSYINLMKQNLKNLQKGLMCHNQ